MCGFVGYINNKNKKIDTITKMNNEIIHRGPSSEGFYQDDYIHLGFRRLSIIDLEGGTQPIFNEDNTKIIMFNGEIYNYQELKDELQAKGHIFKTNTDTEVILHGYEEYHEEILNKLRGMFAFIIWDIKEKEAIIARDIFGIKPMYYANMNHTFMFASEIKALLKHPDFKKEVNKEALKAYLMFQYNPLNETFFKGVYKLEPGHYIKYKDNKIKIKRYYELEFKPKKRGSKKLVKDLRKELINSVEYHKISDVEVGAFLSAGIDSSYITSLLKPNKTFTVGFQYSGFNESNIAKDLSNTLGIENISKIITKEEFIEGIKSVQYYSDEPHANLSSVPLYYLSKLAKEHVNVILSGEGADELFGGYDPYYESNLEQIYRKLPKNIRKINYKLAKYIPVGKIRNLFNNCYLDISETYVGQSKIFDSREANSILNKKYQNNQTPQDITKPYFEKVKGLDDISRKQYVDMFLWLPNDILLKADKMTMANSLEVRVPYLDKQVFEFAKYIPKNWKYKRKTSKYLLREAASNVIPKDWFNRPKLGFLVPFKEFVQDEDVYEKIKEEFISNNAKKFFDTKKIMDLLNKSKKGEATHRKVYTIYCFLIWYRTYFD